MSSTEIVVPRSPPNDPPVPFDYYSALAAEIAHEMRAHASRIRDIQRASVLELGWELIAAKRRVEHGCFRVWVRIACQIHILTAERAMQAAKILRENGKLLYLPPDGLLALAGQV